VLVVDGDALCACDFADTEGRMRELLVRRYGALSLDPTSDPHGFSSQLRAYFQGDQHSLEDIPVTLGGTPFQQLVWSALRRIPVGTTLTYAQLAAELGQPTAYRGVGAANARNPAGIVVPCHRLLGSDGSLTGYSGGTWRKRWLLEHEGVHVR
jgi:methylated-DNA-[protein]-cysteine S-methyltransferase